MTKRVVVLDYGMGNVHSALKALEAAGAEVQLSRDFAKALDADGLVIPGVGAFKAVMDKLKKVNAPELVDKRLAGGKPILGICVGLQVMFEHGFEHGEKTEGLGQWPGSVTEISAKKLPHMGWNQLKVGSNSKLFQGVESELFYFVHSYAAKEFPLQVEAPFQPPTVSFTDYEESFVAAAENGPLTGVQFHPEKSGAAGIRLLKNWIDSL